MAPTTTAFRADIDALAQNETRNHDFKSKTPSLTHACGHMSILLGFADYISQHLNALRENILLICQPAEEGGAGAKILPEIGIYNMAIDFEVGHGYPAVVKDATLFKNLKEAIPEEQFHEFSELFMLSEDFSYYQEKVSGLFYYLAVAMKPKVMFILCTLHNSILMKRS